MHSQNKWETVATQIKPITLCQLRMDVDYSYKIYAEVRSAMGSLAHNAFLQVYIGIGGRYG